VTAEHSGRIRANLANAGTAIRMNDSWITTLALEHQMPLAARDSHFDRVNGLQILKW